MKRAVAQMTDPLPHGTGTTLQAPVFHFRSLSLSLSTFSFPTERQRSPCGTDIIKNREKSSLSQELRW